MFCFIVFCLHVLLHCLSFFTCCLMFLLSLCFALLVCVIIVWLNLSYFLYVLPHFYSHFDILLISSCFASFYLFISALCVLLSNKESMENQTRRKINPQEFLGHNPLHNLIRLLLLLLSLLLMLLRLQLVQLPPTPRPLWIITGETSWYAGWLNKLGNACNKLAGFSLATGSPKAIWHGIQRCPGGE